MQGNSVIDPDDWQAREEAASRLFSGPVDFLRSAPQLQFLPDPVVPEIAFCGRSNVGKSSLLNKVAGEERVDANTDPSMGGEDFSYMLEARPGAGGEQGVEGRVVHVEASLKRRSCVGMGAIIINSIDIKIAKNPT